MDSHKKIVAHSIDMAQVNPMSDDKVMVIREPSTANLYIDSQDRADISGNIPVYVTYPSPWNFTIQRNSSILNGFFTRIAVPEMVLDWQEPNINYGDGTSSVLFSNFQLLINNVLYTYNLPLGFYNVTQFWSLLGSLTPSPSLPGATVITFGYTTYGTIILSATISGTAVPIRVYPSALSQNCFTNQSSLGNNWYIGGIDLRYVKYIDFVCNNLTYTQKLKDASTSRTSRDVLARWYMEWDYPPTYDANGYPILMGYTPFAARRQFNMPKQIRWEPNLPIGNLQFECYTPFGQILANNNVNPYGNAKNSGWRMSLKVSEV